jgi:hypothetical protein
MPLKAGNLERDPLVEISPGGKNRAEATLGKKMMKWSWIFWQVFLPILGPVLLSAIVLGFWKANLPDSNVNWKLLIDDITPWALTVYGMTLIGGGLKDLWPQLSRNKAIGAGMIGLVLGLAIFEAVAVIGRQQPSYTPGAGGYLTAGILLAASIYVCHKAARA